MRIRLLLSPLALGAIALTLISGSAPDPQAVSAAPAEAERDSGSVQTLSAGLWRVDRGFEATIRIKNSLVVSGLTVVPVLYMADGTAYELAPLPLPTAGVATVSVNQALASAPPEIVEHLSEFGSAALRYTYARPAAALGSIQMLDVSQSLVFSYPFATVHERRSRRNILEGLWWKYDRGVGGFVALSNSTNQPLEASLLGVGSRGTNGPATSVAIPAHATKMVSLDTLLASLPPIETTAGGIRVQYDGPPGSLLVSGGLENAAQGYSALIPFFYAAFGSSDATTQRYASIGLMVGEPEPEAGFHLGTRFIPYSVLRNLSVNALDVGITVYYENAGGPASLRLPIQAVAPGEARTVDLERALANAGLGDLNGRITVVFSYRGGFADLLLATGSVDNGGSFVAEVLPGSIAVTMSKEVPMWSVANGSNTHIALWNPADHGQGFLVTLHYGSNGESYKHHLRLEPKATVAVDIKKLIEAQQPDADGNVIPLDVTTGSAVISGLNDVTDSIKVVVSA